MSKEKPLLQSEIDKLLCLAAQSPSGLLLHWHGADFDGVLGRFRESIARSQKEEIKILRAIRTKQERGNLALVKASGHVQKDPQDILGPSKRPSAVHLFSEL